MVKNYALLLFSVLVLTGATFAQSNKNSIELSAFTGLSIFSAEGNTLGGKPYGLEAAYHINMADNQADWVKGLNIRDVSIALSYRNMENIYLTKRANTTGILGDYIGAVSRISVVMAKAGRTEFLLVPGFGFGYATETYYTDERNILVGSHINFTAQIGAKVLTPVGSSARLIGGFDLYHYSNAAFKNPNDGINSVNFSLGIDHDISADAPKTSQHPFKNYEKHSFEFGIGIGRRGLVQTGGGLDPALYPQNVAYQRTATSDLYQSGLYLGYNYRANPVLSLRVGLDADYYYRTIDTVSNIHHFYATYQELGSSYDRIRIGASVGAELWMGKLSFPVNFGHYIHYNYFVPTYDHTYQPPAFYWSFGARYYLAPWVALEAKQYLHRTQADFANFGLVFKLHHGKVD
ncbi:acyloxyacyl hydrolase [Mucilaginibacter sp. PPCGB 2223]|uniref:acyloxyacyl hydrolase n=1 Tax=Mucilaginibacter sp. PPCGB 2223 TaxID=1886027 RepID=UPI00158605ED|nr:acyloxyacyl hydrolase [Mucilaginibacter sp. PPCGB 2223]